jgi:hypothetical protein
MFTNEGIRPRCLEIYISLFGTDNDFKIYFEAYNLYLIQHYKKIFRRDFSMFMKDSFFEQYLTEIKRMHRKEKIDDILNEKSPTT